MRSSRGTGRESIIEGNCFQGGEIVFLGIYEEIVGTVKEVRRDGDRCIVVFAVEREVLLPADSISMDILRGMLGKQIGLLHCDGSYKIQHIKKGKR